MPQQRLFLQIQDSSLPALGHEQLQLFHRVNGARLTHRREAQQPHDRIARAVHEHDEWAEHARKEQQRRGHEE
jgi:hypothetical protein